jgi:hypothetical protein
MRRISSRSAASIPVAQSEVFHEIHDRSGADGMSTCYELVCFTCECSMPGAFAYGSAFHGFNVCDDAAMRRWLGHGEAVGTHEGHDLRIVSDNFDLPWEWDGDTYLGPRHEPNNG